MLRSVSYPSLRRSTGVQSSWNSQECRSGWSQVGDDLRPRTGRDCRSRHSGTLTPSLYPHVESRYSIKRCKLTVQFFLREADVGKSRAEVTAPRLAELNTYVPIKVLEGSGDISPEQVSPFQVVVLTNCSVAKQVEIDEFARSKGIYFISADVRGLFG